MSPILHGVRLDGVWYEVAGLRSEAAPPLPPALDFTVGVTQPTRDLVGCGVIRPRPTIEVGNVTVQAGTVYQDRIINGTVTILGGGGKADGVLENCEVRGPVVEPTSGRAMINTNGCTPTSASTPLSSLPDNVRFCDIIPQAPSAYWNAFGDRWTRAHRCYIEGPTDGFAVHALAASGYVGTRITGCLGRGLTQWAPDYADPNRRPFTHNDWVQAQGNSSPPSDFIIEGNDFDARPHAVWGTQPTTYTELAALMLTANIDYVVNGVTVRAVNATIRNNWLTGGIFTVNAGKTVTAGGYARLIVEGNRMERPGSAGTRPGPSNSIVIDPNYTVESFADNVYLDNGALVPRTNG